LLRITDTIDWRSIGAEVFEDRPRGHMAGSSLLQQAVIGP